MGEWMNGGGWRRGDGDSYVRGIECTRALLLEGNG